MFLAMAIAFEVSGTTCMRMAEGFTRFWPSVLMFVFYILSLGSLTMTLKKIDLSMTYAIWSGVGTAVIAVISVVYFKEIMNVPRVICIGMIIAGVVGLHIFRPA